MSTYVLTPSLKSPVVGMTLVLLLAVVQVSNAQGAYVQAPAAGQQVLAQTVYMS